MRLVAQLFIVVGMGLLVGCASTERTVPDEDKAFRVMSFNLRVNVASDGEKAWPYRKDQAANVVRSHRTDLMGVQEATQEMLADVQARLPGFAWFGVGRADGEEGGEYSAIFYRTARFELLKQATFWLSETPDVPGSKSWDAAIERIVTWGRLRDRQTGATFYLFNTHFDHVGEQARQESARLLLRRIEEIAGEAPVLVTGDFNAAPHSKPYALLINRLEDAFRATQQAHEGPTSTWNGFGEIEAGRRIDFIFAGGPVRILRHAILADRSEGRWPSDHLPVLAEVVVKQP